MDLTEYIINDVKPQYLTSKIEELQLMLNHLTYSHIPIANDDGFIGVISENDVYCFDSDKKIEAYQYAVELFVVNTKTNWLDVLEAFAKNSTNIMPVVDQNNQYIGYYELNDVISLFSEMPFFLEAGAVLVVEKGIRDYSFSEITQIVESNNARVFGAFLSNVSNDLAQITLKISHKGMTEIMQTFRRYGYNIISSHEGDAYIENLQERSAYLKRYLNI
ncbi:MAG: CBS domain-containing protein [Flavobacteriaceae bacterium]|nr:CBS domain-containing protein [Flavobacteriaceae bacterium]